MQVNNSITEDFCSFEVSKFLKEKGFKVKPSGILSADFISSTDYVVGYDVDLNGEIREFQWEDCTCEHLILRPTHAIAIKWIRENFGVELHPTCIICNKDYGYDMKLFIRGTVHVFSNFSKAESYKSIQEATEAALKYFLTELIKEL